jgi:uncharacterized membrane protein YoaK (UPF0700 family)
MLFFFPMAKLGQIFLLAVSAFMVFVFFGGAGLHRYGQVSHWISALSICVLFPLSIALCWPHRITDRVLQHQVATGT